LSDVNSRNKKLFTLDEALSMNRQEMKQNYRQYLNPSLVEIMSMLNFDKLFTRAEGSYVWDVEGNKYLDFLGGYGALNLGHNPPEIQNAIAMVKDHPNILQASLNPLAAALAANLARVTPNGLSRVFFCNSGTEAVEGALKLARATNPARKKIIYCQNSFHGKSFGSLSITGREKYQQPFRPLLPLCEMIPFGNLEVLEQALSHNDVAAFIIEPIQGEGGVILPPPGYLSGVRQLCDQYDTLLIVDEIQTGMGRTGTLFACEHDRIEPDIMCLAKSLGGGVMPIGAYLAKPQIWDNVYKGNDKYALHTSTFGGNSLAMAAGLAALESIITKNLAKEAAEKGNYLLVKLQELKKKHNLIKDVRGKGLLIGIEFNQPISGLMHKLSGGKISRLAEEYLASLVAGELMNKYHIITAYTLNNPQVIRLEPPLTIDYSALDFVIKALDEIMSHNFSGIMFNSIRTVVSSIVKK
jgi:putrescine aminotransferase